MSRKRRIVALAGLFATLATVAAAYFFATLIFEGTGSTTGSKPETKTLALGVAITPGTLLPSEHEGEYREPVTFTAENTQSYMVTEHKLKTTITTNTAGCKPEWFRLYGTGNSATQHLLEGSGEIEVTPGSFVLPGKTYLEETDEAVNQEACAGASVEVHAVLN